MESLELQKEHQKINMMKEWKPFSLLRKNEKSMLKYIRLQILTIMS